jgi:hypothetical protein
MSLPFIRFVSRLLIASLILLPLNAPAGLIGTAEAVSAAQAAAARDKVATLLERADVARQLQSYGLSADAAKARLDALTDAEVVQLAGRIDGLPAGANSTGWVLVILAVVLIWWLFFSR